MLYITILLRTNATTVNDHQECDDHYTYSKTELCCARLSRRRSNSTERSGGPAVAFSPGTCGMDWVCLCLVFRCYGCQCLGDALCQVELTNESYNDFDSKSTIQDSSTMLTWDLTITASASLVILVMTQVVRVSSISVIDSVRIIGAHASTIKTLLSSSSAGSTEWRRMRQDSRSKSGHRTLTHHGHLRLC